MRIFTLDMMLVHDEDGPVELCEDLHPDNYLAFVLVMHLMIEADSLLDIVL